jgi:hypothetical protein
MVKQMRTKKVCEEEEKSKGQLERKGLDMHNLQSSI